MRGTRLFPVAAVHLAFGLEWVPLLSENPVREGRRLARQRRASHCVMSGREPSALGLAWLGERRAAWSAAQVFALLHPRGTAACLLSPDPSIVCLLAAHEGVVIVRGDRIFPDPAAALAAIDELRMAYPRLKLLRTLDTDAAAGRAAASADLDGGGQAVCSLEALAGHADERARLRPAAWRGRRRLVQAGLLLGGAAAFAARWAGSGPAEALPPDTAGAWLQAQHRMLTAHPVHGIEGTRTLLLALLRQPVWLAGWRLRLLSCRLADNGAWRCLSDYERTDPRASNAGLLRQALPGWQLEFPSLDSARAAWAVPLAGEPPQRLDLPAPLLHTRQWASEMQRLVPAFSALRLDPARALEPPPPLDDDGQALPRPSGLPRYALRDLHIDGPLRSALLLVPLAAHVGWRKAALSIAAVGNTAASASTLRLQLEGALYEKTP